MVNNGISGAWAFFYDYGSAQNCVFLCAYYCGYNVVNDPSFRAAVCVPSTYCDGTTMIADNACPGGYIPCIGSAPSSDTAGNYTINCSE
jgi:hypothetical protein